VRAQHSPQKIRRPTTGAGATHFARRLLVRLHD
jgi:hypothetical protein